MMINFLPFFCLCFINLVPDPGSVNGANCKELAAKPDVDGFLVGGASLKVAKLGSYLISFHLTFPYLLIFMIFPFHCAFIISRSSLTLSSLLKLRKVPEHRTRALGATLWCLCLGRYRIHRVQFKHVFEEISFQSCVMISAL